MIRARLRDRWDDFLDSDGFRLAFAAAYLIGSVLAWPFLLPVRFWRWLTEQ